MTSVNSSSIRNLLLSGIPVGELQFIQPDLKLRSLELRHVLIRPDEALSLVTFPESCVVSVVATTATGRESEVGIVGREGLVGLAAVLADDRSPLDCFVQVQGDAIQMPVAAFRRALEECPTLRAACLRYAHNFLIQVSHAALAYSTFSVVERLARWLLMTQDRSGGDDVVITHEFLAILLGVRRAGVTLALQDIERRGSIRTRRGRVTIVDRSGLETIAADSYGVAEADYRRQFASDGPAAR